MSVRKYILERSILQPADIILTGDKGWVSLSVRAATVSRYSHAAIYVEHTTHPRFSRGRDRPYRQDFHAPAKFLSETVQGLGR